MSRERKKSERHQSYGVFKNNPVEHGFRPRGTADNIEEIRRRVKTDKDARMVTNYLLTQNTLRSLQMFKEEAKKRGITDVQKCDKMNRAIRKILRG